jgi:hypothetical protein
LAIVQVVLQQRRLRCRPSTFTTHAAAFIPGTYSKERKSACCQRLFFNSNFNLRRHHNRMSTSRRVATVRRHLCSAASDLQESMLRGQCLDNSNLAQSRDLAQSATWIPYIEKSHVSNESEHPSTIRVC